MVDFFVVSTRIGKKKTIEIYPRFIIKSPSSDLMIRGGDFYAIWLEQTGLWSTSEQDALDLIDYELDLYAEKKKQEFGEDVKVLHMWDAENRMIDNWHKYCQRQMRDSYHNLDENIIFANHDTTKKDYASKKLPYAIQKCKVDAYSELMDTLYSPEERRKIEWAIGSIISGDSKKIQKFLVLYGSAGTGKSTILNIIQKLFEGYYGIFDAKALGSSNNAFALEAFKANPLVAIQHDGDLSRIEDNTRLNSLVSHEAMTVNEKFKSAYSTSFNAFLFMGTNKPVKITDAKSGLIRRLIDVRPTGNKLPKSKYESLIKKIDFELGGIAQYCLDIYESNPGYYDSYVPTAMMDASNDFYNFVSENYFIFKADDHTNLNAAWDMYDGYCKASNVLYPMSKRVFKEELKNYFKNFEERHSEEGVRIRNYYSGFIFDQFESSEQILQNESSNDSKNWIIFREQKSKFDELCADCSAQYAEVVNSSDKPKNSWDNNKTLLKELNTNELHYVRVPLNHIVIDFDIKDNNGNKSLQKNLEAANQWPPTYAELSKSGQGIHLHYIYTGDPEKLAKLYNQNIEIKIFKGKSSLRRKLSKCNNLDISLISSGLPLIEKEAIKVFDKKVVMNEKGLRTLIKSNLKKDIHPGTKPSVDFIKKILDDAYSSGIPYDVSDMYTAIWDFAAASTHHSKECIKMVDSMHFKSEETKSFNNGDGDIIFFDIEVFKNLFLVNWKAIGEGRPVIRMINPSPEEIEDLCRKKLVGFNCRRYDNHILYARMLGKSVNQLYELSQGIISGQQGLFYGQAYGLSYTDVYDFSSKKQSLKKFEIELGISHKELGLKWDEPVPEERWQEVAEYCDNDVLATEAVFNARQADFTARKVLADLAGMTVNDTTNSLTTRIIFGNNRNPQSQFCYRDLSKPVYEEDFDVMDFYNEEDIVFDFETVDDYDNPSNVIWSAVPFFPGYTFKNGVSTYRGETVSEGGYVYAEPGMYSNIALLDIASMHPSSIVAECLFGAEFTKRFKDILDARIAIKHKEYDRARRMFDGKLAKYLNDDSSAKELAQALKIAINSVYGLTYASFNNSFRDPRNVDNIVAKRGALFMIDLKHAVQEMGFTVSHIKTDSIKIPNATPEIIKFVQDFGKRYGYTFEHEATYEKMCLVNDAVYIAKYDNNGPWTATGTQFQAPYIFKTLFSGEQVTFNDLCETKAVTTALYLDNNESQIIRLYENFDSRFEDNEKIVTFKSLDAYLALEDALLDLSSLEKVLKKLKVEYEEAELHNLQFIGKVSRFCPVKPKTNGGTLLREKDGKYYSVGGTKGYRWVESWVLSESEEYERLDMNYYKQIITDAIKTIEQYGNYLYFVSDSFNANILSSEQKFNDPIDVDKICNYILNALTNKQIKGAV